MNKEIRKIATNAAYKLYGNPLPKEIQERLDLELNSIIENEFDTVYIIAQMLVEKASEEGYFIGTGGRIGGSFVAYLLGITEVNPLPKKYNGFNIPFETLIDENENKKINIILNVPSEYYKEMCKYIDEVLNKEDIMINDGKGKKYRGMFTRIIQAKDDKDLGKITITEKSNITLLKRLYEVTGIEPKKIVIEDDITAIGDFAIKHNLFMGINPIRLVDKLQELEINTFDNLIILLAKIHEFSLSKSHFAVRAMHIYMISWYGVNYPKECTQIIEEWEDMMGLSQIIEEWKNMMGL